METFTFDVDQKETIWHRTAVEVKAETLEEAVKQLVFLKKVNTENTTNVIEENMGTSVSTDNHYMQDTGVVVTLESNGLNHTVEVWHNHEVVMTNAYADLPIEPEDVDKIGSQHNVKLTKQQITNVLELYSAEQDNDTTATWDLVVENILYQLNYI